MFGEEVYLKNLYRDRLKNSIVGDDEMNYNYFSEAPEDINSVFELASTMPFFGERRLIILEDTGWFSKTTNVSDLLADIPDTSIMIFVESSVDKRNKLYKAVNELGYAAEFSHMSFDELKQFVASVLGKDNKRITSSVCDYLINSVGSDTINLLNEIEKLSTYALDRDIITKEDIDAVCSIQINNHIFDMIDAVGNKNRKLTMKLYSELIQLREKPLVILFNIIKNFRRLVLIRDMLANHESEIDIAKRAGMPVWALKKYKQQLKNYNRQRLNKYLSDGVDIEYNIKSGLIDEKTGLELYLANLTAL